MLLEDALIQSRPFESSILELQAEPGMSSRVHQVNLHLPKRLYSLHLR